MNRLLRIASRMAILAIAPGLLAASLAQADSPLLNADCLEDISLCTGEGTALEPGQVRIRPVSAIEGPGDGPLRLTNRDLGLSTDELAEKHAPVEVARAEGAEAAADDGAAAEPVAEAPAQDEAPEADTPSAGAPVPTQASDGEADARTEAVPVVAPSEFVADEDGEALIRQELDFTGCMERSIRAGNAFGESQRVCGAVFPD